MISLKNTNCRFAWARYLHWRRVPSSSFPPFTPLHPRSLCSSLLQATLPCEAFSLSLILRLLPQAMAAIAGIKVSSLSSLRPYPSLLPSLRPP